MAKRGKELWASPALARNPRDHFTGLQLRLGGSRPARLEVFPWMSTNQEVPFPFARGRGGGDVKVTGLGI